MSVKHSQHLELKMMKPNKQNIKIGRTDYGNHRVEMLNGFFSGEVEGLLLLVHFLWQAAGQVMHRG